MDILQQLLLAAVGLFLNTIAVESAKALVARRNNKRKRTTPTSTKRKRGGSKKNK
ncbi:hypothetical protein [Bacillus wiedmannii]|uniref:hypothetical protein n=1 Tax=Bacillus wiedmannii TaxID=1890302 RepID=UPI0015CF5B7B|nr:hypothetical protein [Bacillus wiedmannii]